MKKSLDSVDLRATIIIEQKSFESQKESLIQRLREIASIDIIERYSDVVAHAIQILEEAEETGEIDEVRHCLQQEDFDRVHFAKHITNETPDLLPLLLKRYQEEFQIILGMLIDTYQERTTFIS